MSNPDETSVDKVTTRNDRSAEVLSFLFHFSFFCNNSIAGVWLEEELGPA